MYTPITGVELRKYDHLPPEQAAASARGVPGPYPGWKDQARDLVAVMWPQLAELLRLWAVTRFSGRDRSVVEAWKAAPRQSRASVAEVMPLLARALDRWAGYPVD